MLWDRKVIIQKGRQSGSKCVFLCDRQAGFSSVALLYCNGLSFRYSQARPPRPRTLVFAVLASWIAELCFSIPNATNVTHRWIVFLLSLPFGAYKICSRDYEFAAERAKLRIRNFSCILYAPQGRILSNRNSRIHFSLNFPRVFFFPTLLPPCRLFVLFVVL